MPQGVRTVIDRIARRILASFFPAPRQPVRAIDAAPLLLFLAAFVGLCVYLDVTHQLLFARPAAFALLAVTPWLWWMHVAGYAGLGRARGILALAIRLSLCGLFVIL